jgi:hypothetical protein
MSDNDREDARILAFLNSEKQLGDNKPAFEGKLSLPGNRQERRVALWAHTTKQGRTMLAGRVSRSAAAQIEELARPVRDDDDALIEQAQTDSKQFAVDAHEVLLFTNSRKGPESSSAPDYWGYCNPGDGAPLMRLAVWAKTDSRGRAMLSGTVKEHEAAPEEPSRTPERRRGLGR